MKKCMDTEGVDIPELVSDSAGRLPSDPVEDDDTEA